MSGGFSLWHLIIFALLLAIYAAPSIVGFKRMHPQRVPILLLNLFAGWTMIGWVGALVWSAWPLQSTQESS